MAEITEAEVLRRVADRYDRVRSYRTLAAEIGVPKSVLADYLTIGRRMQGPNWTRVYDWAVALPVSAVTARPKLPERVVVAVSPKKAAKPAAKPRRGRERPA